MNDKMKLALSLVAFFLGGIELLYSGDSDPQKADISDYYEIVAADKSWDVYSYYDWNITPKDDVYCLILYVSYSLMNTTCLSFQIIE